MVSKAKQTIKVCEKCSNSRQTYEDAKVLGYLLMTPKEKQEGNKAMSDSQFWAMTLSIFVRGALYADLWSPDDIAMSGTQMEYMQKLQMRQRKRMTRYNHVCAQIERAYIKQAAEEKAEKERLKIFLDEELKPREK